MALAASEYWCIACYWIAIAFLPSTLEEICVLAMLLTGGYVHMRLKKPSFILVLLGMGLLTLILIAPTISATINAIHCKDNSKIMFWFVKPDLILSSGHIEVTCADGSGTVYRPVPPALESASQVRFSPDGKRVTLWI